MNGQEKSDSAIVAGKPTNGAGRPAEEPAEPRAGTEGNAVQQSAIRAQHRVKLRHRSWTADDQSATDLPPITQGRSRMRETRTYGSVRGAQQCASLPRYGNRERNCA